MAVLHVAAMPFPSVQGTQAAVRSMVQAEHEAGWRPQLLTYAHAAYEADEPWPHHRIADLTKDRSLRSGPSWRKLVEDAQLSVRARRLHRAERPVCTIAHHVEAAAACLAARARPWVFFAHTALGPELPAYLPPAVAQLACRAGEALDVTLARRADAVAAVSPWLAERLSREADVRARYVPVPWRVAPPIEPDERARARERLALDPVQPVFSYAGNLDAYQGLDTLIRAFVRVRERRKEARLLIATATDREGIERELRAAGCAAQVRFAPLSEESDRRRVHAATDAAWIPRGVAGGLPMKLLDALSRGVPTVATRRALAGLDLGGAALIVADDDPEAFAASALLAIEGRDAAAALGRRGADYVRRAHAPHAYLTAMGALRG